MRRYIVILTLLLGVFSILIPQNETHATVVSVNSATALQNAITNATPGTIINLTGNIQVTASVNTPDPNNAFANITQQIIINGNGYRIFRPSGSTTEFRFFQVNSGGHLTLVNITLEGGFVYNGGAIVNQSGGRLNLINSHFIGNTATNGSSGGAIHNAGQLSIRNSTFSNNTATVTSSLSGGGAILNIAAFVPTIIIENSTFNNNHSHEEGGAIYNLQAPIHIINSTFVENSAVRHGGAIFGGHITNNSTFINNTAGIQADSFHQDRSNVEINNSILVGATSASMCASSSTLQDANIFSGSNNVINNTNTCGNMTFVSTTLNPATHLGSLANNGGPTPTVALIGANNPAINSAGANATTNDQRGGAVQGGTRDIGAFESGGAVTYPQISGSTISINEGTIIGIPLTNTNGQNFSGTVRLLAYNTGTGTATAGADYPAFTPVELPLTCTAGNCVYSPVTLPTINDALIELPETIIIGFIALDGFATVSSANPTSTITINETGATIAIDAINIIQENPPGSGTFTFTLNKTNVTGSPITVNYTVDGTASASDYTPALTGQIDIPNNSNSAQLQITAVNNNLLDGNRTVRITPTTSSHPLVNSNGAPASITIVDDDTATASINALPLTIGENETPAQTGTFTITLDKTNNTGAPITVNYTIAGTATNGTDYNLTGDGIIANGANNTTLTITPIDNNLLDGSRTVEITLTGTNHTAVSVNNTPATITINDDDTATASINATPLTIGENETPAQTGTFTITLDKTNNSGAPITVNYTVAGTATNGTDYNLTGDGIIANGANNTTLTITPIDNNLLDGSRTVEITLTGTNHTAVSVNNTPATITINDDDTATASITASPLAIGENETPAQTGTFTISLSEPNNTGAPITVDYTVAGTAVDGTDYQPASPFTGNVVIANGASSATLTITPIDNAFLDSSRTVEITLTGTNNPLVGVDATPATITILDDESATASITASPLTIGENETPPEVGTFTISLSEPNNTGAPITIDYTVAGTAVDGTDYNPASPFTGNVVIANGDDHATIEITPIDNNVLDSSRTVEITLTGTDTPLVSVDPTPASITILDDESSYATITASPLTIDENAPAPAVGTFTIALDQVNNTGAPITIDYTVSGTAVDGVDYTPTQPFTGNVVIANGDDHATLEIAPIDNALVDFNRTIEITLTGTDNSLVSVNPAPATITILDDEVAPTPLVTDVIDANGVKIDGITYRLSIDEMTIKFNRDVFDDGTGTHPDSASNPANYILVKKGGNSGVHTASCVAGVSPNDEQILFASVSYNPATFITNIQFNSALPDGEYRLLICATTSIVSAVDPSIHLNNGVDVVVNFTVDSTILPEGATPIPTPAQPEDLGVAELPATGERPLWAELLDRWLGN